MRSFTLCLSIFISLYSQASLAENCSAHKEYDGIVKVVSKNFVDKNFRGLNWPDRVSHYRKKIQCSMNEDRIAVVINQLLAELKTSHTNLYTKMDLDYWALNSIFSENLDDYSIPFSGIWARKIGAQWVSRDVLLGTPAQVAGVRAGDHLLSLDGNEFSPLGWKDGRSSQLRFTSDGKVIREVSIRAIRQSLQSAFIQATRLSEEIIETKGKKIGYFHLWCGTREDFLRPLNESLRRFAEAGVDGLVLDLRNGFGGASLDYLKELKENPALKNVQKVLLINDGVRSGKEWVSAVFKKDQMGTLVGTTTAGAFMGGAPFRLYNQKYFLFLAVAEFIPKDIGPIEGIGVSPDVMIQECHDFCQGRDPQLEKGIEILTAP
jgi:carboxyl-terminal processing protease